MWIKQAVITCLFVLIVSLELYNGLYLYKMDWSLYFINLQSIMVCMAALITLRPQGWQRGASVFLLILYIVELIDELRHNNLKVTFSDYTIPCFVLICFVAFLFYYFKHKKAKDE